MPDDIKVLETALDFQRQGEHEKARALFGAVLDENPTQADALHLDGLSLHALGRHSEALQRIVDAIAVKPLEPMFHVSAGAVAVAGGNAMAALGYYKRALELDPENADACNNLGVALRTIGRFAEAEVALRQAIRLRPGSAGAHINLGVVLRSLGRADEALAAFRKAVEIDPTLAAAHNNLGNALKSQRRYDEALASLDRAVELEPAYADAHFNRALVLAARGDPEAAEAGFSAALNVRRDPRFLLADAGLLPVIPKSREDIEHWRGRFSGRLQALSETDECLPSPPLDTPVMNFYLAYHGANDRDVLMRLSDTMRQMCPALDWTAPHCADGSNRGVDRPRRVGFFSSYFSDHAVAWTMRGLIDHLSRDRFDLTLFAVISSQENILPELRDAATVVELPHAYGPARKAIAESECDILIYPDIGMESLSYLLAHARLAPVQCALWGHPVTTGIPTIDYYISNDVAEPDDGQSQYSERLVRLGGVQTCYRRPDMPDAARPRAPLGLPDDVTVYLCPQSLFKIHPDMDAPLADILRRDPAGRLVLFEGSDSVITGRLRERWRPVFEDVFDRVLFLPRVSVERFLEVVASADILLDTWPFGGGNTSYQGFAAGLPIVTLPGDSLRGRGTLAHYRHMDLSDCIAGSPENYVDIAVRLGTDPVARAMVCADIRDRADVLFNDARAGRAFAEFLLELSA